MMIILSHCTSCPVELGNNLLVATMCAYVRVWIRNLHQRKLRQTKKTKERVGLLEKNEGAPREESQHQKLPRGFKKPYHRVPPFSLTFPVVFGGVRYFWANTCLQKPKLWDWNFYHEDWRTCADLSQTSVSLNYISHFHFPLRKCFERQSENKIIFWTVKWKKKTCWVVEWVNVIWFSLKTAKVVTQFQNYLFCFKAICSSSGH